MPQNRSAWNRIIYWSPVLKQPFCKSFQKKKKKKPTTLLEDLNVQKLNSLSKIRANDLMIREAGSVASGVQKALHDFRRSTLHRRRVLPSEKLSGNCLDDSEAK